MSDSLPIVRSVLRQEALAIEQLASQLDESIEQVVSELAGCQGRLIITGMGKMGQIARKAAATFCSTGSPAMFLHPGEALHGDLGIVTQADVLLALSNSGETSEVNELLPFMKRFGVPVIAFTGNINSTLARQSSLAIDIGVREEAEPITRAPTTSTTVTLALCDALAVALMRLRGFTAEQFAIFHPAGSLGRKLLLTVGELMHTGDQIPRLAPETRLAQAIVTLSQKGLGAGLILDPEERLLGIFTDGDLRRTFENRENPLQDTVAEWMTTHPATLASTALAAEALRMMEAKEITVLPITDEAGRISGILHLHDLLRSGLA